MGLVRNLDAPSGVAGSDIRETSQARRGSSYASFRENEQSWSQLFGALLVHYNLQMR
jgi:hypothetical protein